MAEEKFLSASGFPDNRSRIFFLKVTKKTLEKLFEKEDYS
jgi:hypothetical protein